MNTYILHSLDESIANKLSENWLKHNTHIRFQSNKNLDLSTLRQQYKVDINLIPKNFNPKKIELFISDMDSTLINIECVDEIADFANVKPQVAEITELAMQGKLDFSTSLKQRVALLKNLPIKILEKVFNERLQINGGGEKLIKFLNKKNIKTVLVSGGFTFFVNKLKQKLNLTTVLANELEVNNNLLTGRIIGDIVDAQAKADCLKNLCEKYQISLKNTIAIGDGANDLLMMKIAGLSIAYHAKTIVKNQTDIVIDYGDLSLVLDLLS
ncbi:Phosphoserine phosphatase [hydrothermal vent metagenome]|uniref:phosphoserine phosphatase n=1 Tax=hydrothermal vent metagenome TaxID=652676 RepID=A0A1W1CV63_9ZZZZ